MSADSIIVPTDISTDDLKTGIAYMINHHPFVLFVGSDRLIEKALTPKDPTANLYMYGKKLTDSPQVKSISFFKALKFPLDIPSLVVHVEKRWSIVDGLILKAIARKVPPNGAVILSGKVDELLELVKLIFVDINVVKGITNHDHTLFLGIQGSGLED